MTEYKAGGIFHSLYTLLVAMESTDRNGTNLRYTLVKNKKGDREIAIIIPALNEELAIRQTIRQIPLPNAEIVVVDNGSTDQTAQYATEEGAVVISEKRKGYGYACLAGINYLVSQEKPPELVIFLDADGSDDPGDLTRLLAAKQTRGSPDIIMGSRLDRLKLDAMSAHAIIANRVFTRLIWLLYRVPLRDMGPMRIMELNTLLDIGMQDTGYGWASEMIVKAIKRGYSIGEIPVSYRPRIGESKISGSLVTSLSAAIWITIHILRHTLR